MEASVRLEGLDVNVWDQGQAMAAFKRLGADTTAEHHHGRLIVRRQIQSCNAQHPFNRVILTPWRFRPPARHHTTHPRHLRPARSRRLHHKNQPSAKYERRLLLPQCQDALPTPMVTGHIVIAGMDVTSREQGW